MANEDYLRTDEVISFGPFRLSAARRLLDRERIPLHLGSRALEILIVLVERAGEVVSKKELIARVWPDAIVDEGSLRFHVAALRKALGDRQANARYISTLRGWGYCFVAPISRGRLVREESRGAPVCVSRMVGRSDDVDRISRQLMRERFVTIVGAGGVGKTAIAASVGNGLLSEFEGAVRFCDFGPLINPNLIKTAVASTLGLDGQSSEQPTELVTFLRDKRILLIFDNCEHVIEAVSALAECIVGEAPPVHILATSREALRIEGETVYWLPPLQTPPDDYVLTAKKALRYTSVQLFVERVAAYGHRLELSDENASIVGAICCRLDGIPLAIDVAASRLNAYGVAGTAALLDDHLWLSWRARRTTVDRHQTLGVSLDRSYRLLSERESIVLRRLAVFAGYFTLEAARFVAAGDDYEETQVVAAIGSLVEKSLIFTKLAEGFTDYRLLNTTRAYLTQKLHEIGELEAMSQRHQSYYRNMSAFMKPGDTNDD